MSRNEWNAVDDYFNAALQPPDEALAAALARSDFAWPLRLARRGSLIVVDNVVRGDSVVEVTDDAAVAGTRAMVDLIAREKRVCASAIQTAGHEGHDGLFAQVVADA